MPLLLPVIVVDQAGDLRGLPDLALALPVGVVLLNAATVEFGMRPLGVVVFHIGVDHRPERFPAQEKTVRQAFVFDLPDKLLGVVVHDRRSGRDDLRQNADPSEIPVHFLRITPVAVADQKAGVRTERILAVAGPPFDRVHEPLRGAVLRGPGDEHPLRLQMDEEQREEGPLAVVGPDLCGEEVARPRDDFIWFWVRVDMIAWSLPIAFGLCGFIIPYIHPKCMAILLNFTKNSYFV